MVKRKDPPESLNLITMELASFVASFDVANAEDAQIRTDALISCMVKAGVLKESPKIKKFRLHVALESVKLPIPKREAIVARAEMFHDLINSYDGEPGEDDMEQARELLEEIANALNVAIDLKLERTAPTLFDGARQGSK